MSKPAPATPSKLKQPIHPGLVAALRRDAQSIGWDADEITAPDLARRMEDAGAIKRRGGGEIEAEAVVQGPVEPGESVLTGAGRLPARHVIHAAVMGQDLRTDGRLIKKATTTALRVAASTVQSGWSGGISPWAIAASGQATNTRS